MIPLLWFSWLIASSQLLQLLSLTNPVIPIFNFEPEIE
jgi:hypothetical protein